MKEKLCLCAPFLLWYGVQKICKHLRVYFPKARLLHAFKHITLEYQEMSSLPFSEFSTAEE